MVVRAGKDQTPTGSLGGASRVPWACGLQAALVAAQIVADCGVLFIAEVTDGKCWSQG